MKLSETNFHERDKNITFYEENHEYVINGLNKKPISVTTLIHHFFPEFDSDVVIDKMMKSKNWPLSKYFGKTREEIKDDWEKNKNEAATAGTFMHKSIEDFLNGDNSTKNNSKEFTMFMNFWNDISIKYPSFKIFRTEWLVYDENIGLAGSIDCVLKDSNNDQLIIVDWKRSKEIKLKNPYEKGKFPFDTFDHCNYSHYGLQLNFYRHILETKYNHKVSFMMLVVLHPNQDNYICYPVNKIELSGLWNGLNTYTSHSSNI